VSERIPFSEIYVIDIELSSVLFAIVERYWQAILSELTSIRLNKNASHSFFYFFFFRGGYNIVWTMFFSHLPPLLLIRQSLKASIIISVVARSARSDISSAFPLSAVARATKDAIIAKPRMRSDRSFSRVFREQTTMRGGYCRERRLISAAQFKTTGALLFFRVECGDFNFRSV